LGRFCDNFASNSVRDAAPLAPNRLLGVNPAMTDQKPIGPFTMTPARIAIVVLAVLAVAMILGAIGGGLSNYQTLREAVPPEPSASSSAP
jgi:hypothetical protein